LDFLLPALLIVAVALAYVAGFCIYYDRVAFQETTRGPLKQTVGAKVVRVIFGLLWPVVALAEILMRVVGIGENPS